MPIRVASVSLRAAAFACYLNSTTDRVHYPSDRLLLLASEAIRDNSFLSTEDCIGLIQDAFALGLAGVSRLSDTLELAQTISQRENRRHSTLRRNSLVDCFQI